MVKIHVGCKFKFSLIGFLGSSTERAVLEIKDNGSGLEPRDFSKMLLSFGKMKPRTVETNHSALYEDGFCLNKFGLGFKLSAFRLGGSVLVFSKAFSRSLLSTNALQGQVQTFCVGLLSTDLLAKSQCMMLQAPIAAYERD